MVGHSQLKAEDVEDSIPYEGPLRIRKAIGVRKRQASGVPCGPMMRSLVAKEVLGVWTPLGHMGKAACLSHSPGWVSSGSSGDSSSRDLICLHQEVGAVYPSDSFKEVAVGQGKILWSLPLVICSKARWGTSASELLSSRTLPAPAGHRQHRSGDNDQLGSFAYTAL